MFNQEFTPEYAIIKYKNAKDIILATFDYAQLMGVIVDIRKFDKLDEGKKLDYIEHKISNGLPLDEDEEELIMSTLSLHQVNLLIREDGTVEAEGLFGV